ncbi:MULTISPECIES: DapH/DapD/GlmU-related protein [unclassified Shewanella]|uniref:DapH/DapD/GlmU-related protein n=1 Tax=unclassified Shewanella TaxID=196818 RepID=UPI00354C2EA7
MRFSGYGFFHAIYLSLCLILTKVFYPKARLIRFPFRLRTIGVFNYHKGLTIGFNNRIDVYGGGLLTIGENVQINDHCHLACSQKITVGANCLIASRVYITDHDHDFSNVQDKPIDWPLKSQEVIIGENTWIGEGVCILKGVIIGSNCVVGANSVVTKSMPCNSVLAGVPAKVISKRFI